MLNHGAVRSWFDPDLYGSESEAEEVKEVPDAPGTRGNLRGKPAVFLFFPEMLEVSRLVVS